MLSENIWTDDHTRLLMLDADGDELVLTADDDPNNQRSGVIVLRLDDSAVRKLRLALQHYEKGRK